MGTAFFATNCVILRRRPERSAAASEVSLGMVVEKRKSAPAGALCSLLFFRIAFRNRQLRHTLQKFILLVYNHLTKKTLAFPLDRNFPQFFQGDGSAILLPEKPL